MSALVGDLRSFLELNPVGVFVLLVGLVAGIYALSETRVLGRVFDVLPVVFWVYFLPMVLATVGVFPSRSPVYNLLSEYVLPASLFLLFLSSNLPDIVKLGPRTIGLVLAGSVGIVLGAVVGVAALIPFFATGRLPAEHADVLWKGVAALSGSWIGGSANMAAVWESVRTQPQQTALEGQIFSAMVAVDVIVAYGWMAVVIALSAWQGRVDRRTKADTTQLEMVNRRIADIQQTQARYLTTSKFTAMIAVAFLAALICSLAGSQLNDWLSSRVTNRLILSVIGPFAIMIVLVTALGLACSLTPLNRLEGYGASRVGYAMLYLVLARIGARANLNAIGDFPWYLLMGVVWVMTHAAVLLGTMRLLRAPMFFAATSSQANIGGPVSAPVVAAAYQPNLAVVGLLMAVVGNIAGTFLALFCVAPLVQLITPLLK
ncbi:MAG: DUF819 family protein [Candidatus Sumerlaeia bacterium]